MINIILQNSNAIELMIFLIVGILLLPIYLNSKNRSINTYTFMIFFSFFLILIHSIFFSWEPFNSSIDSLLAILKLIILFLIIKLISKKVISKFVKIFLILLSLITIVPSILLLMIGQQSNFSNDGNFHSIFPNSNMLGMYLALFVAPFIFSLKSYFIAKKNLYKYLFHFLVFSIFYILIATSSRTNILIFIICSIIVYLNRNGVEWSYKSILKVFSFCLITISTLFIFFEEFFLGLILKGQLSIFTTRLPLWISRIQAITEKPFTGWGYNVNEFYFFNKFNVFNPLEKGNTVLAIIEEFGMIFGIFLIFVFTKVFIEAYKKYNNLIDLRFLGVIILLVPFHLMVETWLLNFNSILAIFIWFTVINGLENYNEI